MSDVTGNEASAGRDSTSANESKHGVTRREFLRFGAFGAGAVLTTGAARSAAGRSPLLKEFSARRAPRPITFWVITSLTPDSTAGIYRAITEYQKNTGGQVTLESVDPNTLDDKLTVAVKAGSGPDVVSVDMNNAPALASAGVLKSLDSRFGAIADSFAKVTVESGQYAGVQYSVPWYTNNLGLFINPKMLEKAGVSKAPETWGELADAAAKVSDGSRYGIMLGAAGYGAYMWWPFLWQNKGAALQPSGKKVAFDSASGIQSWKFLADLYLRHHAVPPAFVAANSSWNQITEPFAQEQVAMTIIGDFGITPIADAAPKLKFEVAPLPHNKEAATIRGGFNLAIPRTSRNVSAAWDFIEWLSAPRQVWILDSYKRMSALKDIEHSRYARNPLHEGFVRQASVARALPAIPQMGFINWVNLANAWSATILQQGSPESELLKAAVASNKALA